MATDRAADAGERDKPVLIEQLPSTDVDDAAGAPNDIDNWTTLERLVWMKRRDFSGAERFRADQVSSSISSVWEMPYQPTMDPDIVDVPKLRRLVFRGRTYGIVAARVVGPNEMIELTTLAGTKI
jgi:head-tail joining protein